MAKFTHKGIAEVKTVKIWSHSDEIYIRETAKPKKKFPTQNKQENHSLSILDV